MSYKKLGEYIRPVDVRNKEGKEENLLGVSTQKFFMPSIANTIGTDFSKYKIVKRNQFTYVPDTSRRGDKIGLALLTDYDEGLVSNVYTVFEVIDKTKLLPEYLIMWFKRPEFDRYARFKSHGSVREIFDWNEMCDAELPIPSITEQEKIVWQYKTITDRIELKKKINKKLEETAQAIFKSWFVDFEPFGGEMPTEWKWGTIRDYAEVKSGFAFKSEWWCKEGNKVIKIGNIVDNTIDLASCDCVSEEHSLKAKNFKVGTGDILIAMTGATTGKIGIIPLAREDVFVNQRVGKFFLGENPMRKNAFLFSALLSDDIAKNLRPGGSAGSAQDNLSPDDIMSIELIIPSEKSIEMFNAKLKPIMKIIVNNWAIVATLQQLQSLLLSRLLKEGKYGK